MSTKKEPPPPLPKLVTLNKGLKLAEKWVKNMHGEVEEAAEIDMEGRPSRLGLGAKVPRKSHVGPLNDPVERRLYKKYGGGRKKSSSDQDTIPTPKNEIDNDDEDDDENIDSRTNAFAKKRAALVTTTPLAKKRARIGLGAKVPRKSHVGPLNDPVERRLYKKYGGGRKKSIGDQNTIPAPKNEIDIDDLDDDDNIDSRTNAFAKERATPMTTTPLAKKKAK